MPFSLKFKITILPASSPHPQWNSPDTVNIELKNYLKWQKTWQLDSCTVDDLEGKKLV